MMARVITRRICITFRRAITKSGSRDRYGQDSASARAALERRTIHIPDVRADPEYTYGTLEELRTILAVPILKGDNLLGGLAIYHLQEVRPFTDKQIALVETFAD